MPSDTVMLVGTLIPIVAILVGGLVILIPVAGLTLRFALKPALEALGKLKELQSQGQEIRLLEQRLSLVEEQMHQVTQVRDWERSLKAARRPEVASASEQG
jgi:hypothetical protein